MPAGFLAVKEKDGDIDLQKEKWIQRMNECATYNNPEFVHDFFGKMTKDRSDDLLINMLIIHLRQFGC
jgi:hypothetical protein